MIWTFLFSIFSAAFANADNTDYFLDQVQRNIDYNVNPCENFYRHACPKSMSDQENAENFAAMTALSWIQHQKENHPLPESNIERLYKLAQLGKSKYYRPPRSAMINFLDKVRDVYYFIDYLRENDVHISKEYIKFRKIATNIMNITAKNMKMTSDEMGQNYTAKLLEKLDAHQLFFGLEMEGNTYKNFAVIVRYMDDIYEQHFKIQRKKPISESDIVENSDQFFDIINSLFDTIYHAIVKINERKSGLFNLFFFNAVNENNVFLKFYEAVLLPARNTVLPAAYGYVGHIFGHELMHSYLTNREVLEQEMLLKKGLCTVRHAQKMCDVFGEGLCDSGLSTYMEDAADYEGSKLAYKAFINEIGEQLKEPVAPGLNVTNQQMFFYAQAKSWCQRDPAQTDIRHSSNPVRINGAVSLINGFHEAFSCKIGDRMRDVVETGGHCNHFGNIVRR